MFSNFAETVGELFGLKSRKWVIKNKGSYYYALGVMGTQEEMQDSVLAFNGYEGLNEPTIFGVFDGHGGAGASQLCSKRMGEEIVNHPDILRDPRKSLKEAFIKLDDEYCNTDDPQANLDGTSATVIYLAPDYNHSDKRKERMRFAIASVGNTRAILVKRYRDKESGRRKFKAEQLSFDHDLTRKDEFDRVVSEGGEVKHFGNHFRVYHEEYAQEGIDVTRSIGDRYLRPYILSEPEAHDGYLDKSCEYIVIASNGLWGHLENANDKVVQEVCNPRRDLLTSVERLITYSEGRQRMVSPLEETSDNITVMAIRVQPLIKKLATASIEKERRQKIERRRRRQRLAIQAELKQAKKETVIIPGLDPNGYLIELLLWKAPARSFLWFITGLLAFFLIILPGYSVITIVSFMMLFRLFLTTVVVKSAMVLEKLGFVKKFDYLLFVQEGTFFTQELSGRAQRMTKKVTGIAFAQWEYIVYDAPLAEVIEQFPSLLYFFTPLSFEHVALVAFIAMFSLVVTYERNKRDIDAARMRMASVFRKFLRLFGLGGAI